MGPRGREEVVIHCGVVAVTMEGRGEAPPGLGHMELSQPKLGAESSRRENRGTGVQTALSSFVAALKI